MKVRLVFLTIVLLCVSLLGGCSKNKGTELANGISLLGEAYVKDDCNVLLHFSTLQRTNDGSAAVRKARAESQFLCCDKDGAVTNSFLVNREILCNPVVHMDSVVSVGFMDFSLICTSDGVEMVDDSSALDLSEWTGQGPLQSGYIEEDDTTYYLFNLGTGPIDGQYTTILRFVNSQTSYDVTIPYPIMYVAYDVEKKQFIYRVDDYTSDNFLYGFIDYNPAEQQFRYNEPEEPISYEMSKMMYGDWAFGGFRALYDDNVVYEVLTIPVNEQVVEDLQLPSSYLDNSECWWGVLMLSCYDLKEKTLRLEYLNTEPIAGDLRYGLVMFGTEQMPVYAANEQLYIFTCDEKLSIYDPKSGFSCYDVKFDTTGTLDPDDMFNKDSQVGITLGNGSPLKIFDDGSLYVGHAYSDGSIKIHKYNFSEQRFELYWTSATGILDLLDKQSLKFVSFELVN